MVNGIQLGMKVRVNPTGETVPAVPGVVWVIDFVDRKFVEELDPEQVERLTNSSYNLDGTWVAYCYRKVDPGYQLPDSLEGIYYLPVEAFERIVVNSA